MSAISVQELKKYYGATRAVDGITFDIGEGEIVGFLGPNGAGKTTTIRCMMDFLRPDSGSISILGLDSQKDSEILKEDIGFLPGEVYLYDKWTGKGHIDLIRNLRKNQTHEDELIAKLDFDPSKRTKSLSTGNKQKLGLILALMHKPKVLILDEPTSGLDPILQNTIYEILKGEARNGTTIFFSSHNLAEVERICNTVCIIKQGKIVSIENVTQLKKKRLYTIQVYFDEKVSKTKIQAMGAEILKEYSDGYVLKVKGEVLPFLRKLDDYKIKDIEISHTNLEALFLEFYK